MQMGLRDGAQHCAGDKTWQSVCLLGDISLQTCKALRVLKLYCKLYCLLLNTASVLNDKQRRESQHFISHGDSIRLVT